MRVKLRLCIITCLVLIIVLSMYYSLTLYESPANDPHLLQARTKHTDRVHMNDGIRHQLMAQDLLEKKILPPVVKNTLVKNVLRTEHALNLTDTMMQVGVYDKTVDIVQNGAQKPTQKLPPIEADEDELPPLEQAGEDESPPIEQAGKDETLPIELTGGDETPPIKMTGKGNKKVLLFTYMRGGSTFLGSIFATHPEAIYWYEGLAPFYSQFLLETKSATYSVWFDVQNDLKIRTIVPDESVAIAEYLDGMMNCNLDVMNPVAFRHPFIKTSKTTRPLRRCANRTSRCAKTKPEECTPVRLNDRLANKCHVKLEAAHQCYLGHNESHCKDPELKSYNDRLKCYTAVQKSSTCVRNFERVCNKNRLRTTKVHRLSMQSVETIIQKIPDIYIVFYVRDPRGTFVSRIKNAGMPIRSLCKQMEQDHQIYTELKLKYPESLHMLRYEDLAIDQEETLQDLFGFLDEPIPEVTRKYLASISNATSNDGRMGVRRSDSVKTANAWRQKIRKDVYEESRTECAKVIELLGYKL